ncbi:C4-dicarboxylate ABC transporter substrate-binding protein [Kordiimonas sediminis]|uniref:TRAP transporter small permease protein n=1 Tax=Kordiimonas sediminis TaxID=1735581 RepID=A0A919E8X6_9PROT|nr:TRAP transporter small permease subunit [Kordiimonas sediminis]GHF26315.1 C4-dicarboxylate ABC transporter substrate-binding protein [Kordiimonas sediminis]
MARLLSFLDAVTERTGSILSFLPIILVLVQFMVVLVVYIFSEGSIKLQESLQYINAVMFLGAAGYTALHDEHVRVDLLYSKASPRTKAWINLAGTLFLLLPFLGLLWYTTLPYVMDSWSIQEKSVEASGLPFVYILKSTILLFTLTMTLSAIADLLRYTTTLFGKKH